MTLCHGTGVHEQLAIGRDRRIVGLRVRLKVGGELGARIGDRALEPLETMNQPTLGRRLARIPAQLARRRALSGLSSSEKVLARTESTAVYVPAARSLSTPMSPAWLGTASSSMPLSAGGHTGCSSTL